MTRQLITLILLAVMLTACATQTKRHDECPTYDCWE